MRIVTTVKEVFQYSELSDSAKQEAREWLAGLTFGDSSDWEFVYSDAQAVAELLGITLHSKSGRTVGGGTWSEPAIYFSGFSSQGDGACFEGVYCYAKGAPAAIKAYAPQDAELLRIAKGLQAVQRRNFYRLRATCKQHGHYSHSGCMHVEVEDCENQYRDIGDAEDDVTTLLRDFADWIYAQLEKEYDFQTSDEQIEEAILANEYEFTEEGARA